MKSLWPCLLALALLTPTSLMAQSTLSKERCLMQNSLTDPSGTKGFVTVTCKKSLETSYWDCTLGGMGDQSIFNCVKSRGSGQGPTKQAVTFTITAKDWTSVMDILCARMCPLQ